MAGRHVLLKNTGIQASPQLLPLRGRAWWAAWEDTHVMQMNAQADAQSRARAMNLHNPEISAGRLHQFQASPFAGAFSLLE
ncbi:hypothetical protein [Pseudomonas sp. PS01301]|uniref:hypothetical protein n=1 Tax=Pseudomonas sp. PS01301 TaxID=2991437 RepID=UPI002499EA71|nr:hypothetical protein [Pseudomonas sp. PS01301]